MITLQAEVQIAAPAERIWELLADGASYVHWNPMLQWGAGTLTAESRRELTITLPGIPSFTQQPVFVAVIPQQELSWRHRLPVPGLLSWTQSFAIEQLSPEVRRVSQRVILGGLLAPLYQFALGRLIQHALDTSSVALRRWAGKEVRCHRC